MRWTERRAALLAVHADDGTVGLGEAWSHQSDIAHVLDALAEAGRSLAGTDLDAANPVKAAPGPDVPSWVAPAAASAIDMALWDLRAKRAGMPLWRMLGTGGLSNRGAVAVYASGGLYRDGATDADLAREMQDHLAAGFTAVKIKIGALAPNDDLARVRAVRQAIGDATLWVDAVNQLDAATAVAYCRALDKAGAQAIQAPVGFDDLDTMALIQREALPVIAGESEHRYENFGALLKSRAVGGLQFCLGLCGGYTGAARLTAMAAAQGAPSTPQCNSTAVMQAASLQFGAAQRNVATVEYHRFHDHLAPLLPECMRDIAAGRVTLDSTPGLGIANVETGAQPGGGEIIPHAELT
jgi:L-alanine-DL-glutamate epimerase-like enolase superfamily enzyme